MSTDASFDDWLIRALSNPKIEKALKDGHTITTIRPDPDLLGATSGQAHLLIQAIPSWTPAMTDAFSIRTNAVALKLTALRYHLRRYRKIQGVRLAEISANELVTGSMKKGLKFCELDMLHEVEAMFFQYKSTLDMLVKVLCPITGRSSGTFSTYGNSGSKLIPILRQLKNDKKLNLTGGRVDWLIEEIVRAKSPWLESVITIRDTFSHYQPEINFGFEWDPSMTSVIAPQFDTSNGRRQFDLVMEELIELLVRYCTQFIAIAVSCAIPLEQGVQVMSENEKAYLSARWNQDLSRAIWKRASNVIYHYSEEDIELARQTARSEDL